MKIYFFVLFGIVLFISPSQTKDWWETSAFYQIYPRSFKDSDGDGIGDLNGVTSKLPYLKEIGINATWLSPIFKSPMADFGYDISDFYSIQPEYGTMADFENMIATATTLGIKIILDFVPNHSSDENDWFLKSENRTVGFEDYYIWHNGSVNSTTNERVPPSNWLSFFFGSAWEWNDTRQQYYLHQFHKKQPDLNYRSAAVVAQMKDVLTFWLDKGVAGFRCDIVPAVFEIEKDENGGYPDEPSSGYVSDIADDPSTLSHIYTQDRNETLDMVYQWRELLDVYMRDNGGDMRIMMTESYSQIDTVMRYYGDGGTRLGSHIPFNFILITYLTNSSTATDFKTATDTWLTKMPTSTSANWVMGNHDQRRVGSRFGTDRIDLMSMIIHTLPGASVTYNGEEIGMTDGEITWEETVDPQACNTNEDDYDTYSRDPARTPFQWDTTTSAGFSNSTTTWLPVASNYLTVNVAVENATAKSHFNIYKKLIKLRQTNTLKYGSATTQALSTNVFGIVRSLDGNETYITIANLGRQEEVVNLTSFTNVTLPTTLTYFIVGVSSAHVEGEVLNSTTLTLSASESFILQSNVVSSSSVILLNSFYLLLIIFSSYLVNHVFN